MRYPQDLNLGNSHFQTAVSPLLPCSSPFTQSFHLKSTCIIFAVPHIARSRCHWTTLIHLVWRLQPDWLPGDMLAHRWANFYVRDPSAVLWLYILYHFRNEGHVWNVQVIRDLDFFMCRLTLTLLSVLLEIHNSPSVIEFFISVSY